MNFKKMPQSALNLRILILKYQPHANLGETKQKNIFSPFPIHYLSLITS